LVTLRLTATAFFVVLFAAPDAHAQAKSSTCEHAAELSILSSPIAPWKGAPLRAVFAAEKPLEGELSLVAPNGSVAATTRERHGGPPYFWFAEIASPAAGTWQVKLQRDGAVGECSTITREIVVRPAEPPRPRATAGSVWPVRNGWDRGTENLYSAWIEKLFDAPLDTSPSWKALHEVLRDQSRNFLFNHMGLGEDSMGLVIRPDCADLPYFLRAYFAFKMGLPFGYAKCTRGGGGEAPKCPVWWNIQNEEPPRSPPPEEIAFGLDQSSPSGSLFGLFRPAAPPARGPAARPAQFATAAPGAVGPSSGPAVKPPPGPPPRPPGLAASFAHYLRWSVGDGVHSGAGRTRASADDGDFYPVPLSQDALRPGTVYADPYGHLLVLARRIPQSDGTAGVFLAVDAQPDGTVARKRFWRGNFLFAQQPALGDPGFKRFRPIMRENGTLRRLTNREIAKHPNYGDYSLDQTRLSVEQFYDRMDDVMSPAPLDPLRAMTEAITSLEEQVKARVTSVENGRKFQISGRGEATMPDGPAIFETTGAWEDFATPSRDLRLLIAIDVVRGYPDRVSRRPERYAMPKDKSVADVKAELEAVLASELTARRFSYTRSDGSSWTLSVKDVLDRAGDLEMAYNLNDCVELRWGASEGSDEAATCKRRAPQAQRGKMTEYRAWFHERRRPPRV
jgi:hypothetical protein